MKLFEWNHNAKPWYGIADFDIAKTISMEAVLPEIDIFVRFWHGSFMKQVNKLNSLTINQVKWMFSYANVCCNNKELATLQLYRENDSSAGALL